MKKIIFMAAMFAATVCNAQVVLWNGSDKEINSDGGFWNRADPTVVDDNGNKCLKVTLRANPDGWADEHRNIALPLGESDFQGLRRLSMRIKMTDAHNVLVKLVKDGDGGYNSGRIFWCEPNEWQTLVFDFSVGPDNDKIADTGNTVLEIWPYEQTNQGDGKEVFVDDIQLNGPMVNGKGLYSLADNSLTGEVKITGNLETGHYQNTWDGDWHSEDFSDYDLIAAKLAVDATVLDVTEAKFGNPVWDAINAKCPNITIKQSTTSVSSIRKAQTEENIMYNLNGQRLAQPQKGINIVNGKKIIVR